MKVTNILVYIVLIGVFIGLFTQFLNVGVSNYDLVVDSELNDTINELNTATQNENISTITNSLDTANDSATTEGTGEILQFKKANSLITTARSIKPITNTMFTSVAEFLEVPLFIKVAFGSLLGIGLLSWGVWLILGRKP